MAARKIKNQPASLIGTPIVIYFDSDYGEYQVKIKGKPNATYFTSDKADAFSTAQAMRNEEARIFGLKQNPAPKSKANQDVFTRANQLIKEGYERKQAFAIAYRERDADLAHLFGKPKAKRNPVKRKTAARTQRAAVGYVNRPSQITKKAPSKRLKTRRTKNLQVPRGVFPNPSSRGIKFSAAQLAALRAEYNKISGIDPANATYKKLVAKLDTMPQSALKQLADAKIKWVSSLARNRVVKNNPDSVHFDIDVNSHNARGSKAKTRTNPAARKKEIIVEYELSGQKYAIRNRGAYGWKELAKFPDTPEGSENAIQYAEAYHKIAPHLRIQVVTK